MFQFGDQETADIKLRLIDENGDETNLYLHSQVLKETILYEAWLSQGRQPLELKINVSAEIFLKCFELMYSCEAGERFCFSGVDETLDILPVVSQMIFRKGVNQCMKYLNAVSWSPEQESKLRVTLSSLRINILPELAVRLCSSRDKSSCADLDTLKQTLQDMLSTMSFRSKNSVRRREVEKYIVGFFEAAKKSSAKGIAETCRDALLEEFRANVERIKFNEFSEAEEVAVNAWSNLLWLFDIIRGCDGKLYQKFIELFCADCDLGYSAKYSRIGVKIKVDILLDRSLNAMGNGEIMTPASFRVYFLTNWLYAMVLLVRNHPMKDEKLSALETGIMNVADTLPLPLQKSIYNLWKDAYGRLSMDYSNALKWWAQKVQDAIKNGKII